MKFTLTILFVLALTGQAFAQKSQATCDLLTDVILKDLDQRVNFHPEVIRQEFNSFISKQEMYHIGIPHMNGSRSTLEKFDKEDFAAKENVTFNDDGSWQAVTEKFTFKARNYPLYHENIDVIDNETGKKVAWLNPLVYNGAAVQISISEEENENFGDFIRDWDNKMNGDEKEELVVHGPSISNAVNTKLNMYFIDTLAYRGQYGYKNRANLIAGNYKELIQNSILEDYCPLNEESMEEKIEACQKRICELEDYREGVKEAVDNSGKNRFRKWFGEIDHEVTHNISNKDKGREE